MIEKLSRDSKIQSDRAYAEKEIAAIWKWTRPHIWKALGIEIEAHRPQTKEELHREWSRLIYLGSKPEEIAAKAGMDVEDLKRTVRRLRKRRAEIHWILCAAILRADSGHNYSRSSVLGPG